MEIKVRKQAKQHGGLHVRSTSCTLTHYGSHASPQLAVCTAHLQHCQACGDGNGRPADTGVASSSRVCAKGMALMKWRG